MKITKSDKEALRKFQSKGGKKSFKKLGVKGMSDLGKKGAKVRWGKDALMGHAVGKGVTLNSKNVPKFLKKVSKLK